MLIQKIMVVDDDPDVVSVLTERIESYGFECQSYTSVDMALLATKIVRPDLIILNLEFAQTTGTVFFESIRDYLGPDDTCPPVIVLNSEDDHQIMDYAFDLGTAAFQPDVCTSTNLKNMLSDYLPNDEEIFL